MILTIKHIPNGITPYKEDPYERKPQYPTKEDSIEIKCVAVHCDETAQIRLHLIMDGEKKVFHPETKLNPEKKEMYCSFTIGKIESCNEISYYFEGAYQNKEIRTKEYTFSIQKWVNGIKPDAVMVNNHCMVVHLEHESKLAMVIYYKNGVLNKVVCEDKYVSEHTGDASIFEQVADEIYQFRNIDSLHAVEVNKASLDIAVKNSQNETILGFNPNNMSVREDAHHNITSIEWMYETPSKGFFGFGERYDSVNQKGKDPDIYVIEEFANQKEKTYMPVPFFMTEKNYGMYIDTTYHTYFDLGKDKENTMAIQCDINPEELYLSYQLVFGTPREMLQQYYQLTGYPKLPPKWAFGPWMSSNRWNTQEETLKQLAYMKEYDIPATVLVLEAWSDEITFYNFNDAQYKTVEEDGSLSYSDYHFSEEGKWRDPKGMIDTLHDHNVKLILWQIPVIKYEYGNEDEQHKIDEAYVIKNKLCVMNDDGTPYRIPDNWFAGSLIPDFTNPKTVEWWFNKRKYLTEELGVDGFKTDGGEFIYDDSCLFHNGQTGAQMRNQYPISYIEAYTNFIGEDRVLFSRAGYTGAGKYPMHWAGDKYSTFEELKSAIVAGLTANISGIPFWGYDIGGFAGDMPSTELFIRSAEAAAFSPVMQFHSEPTRSPLENNDRTPWNIAEETGDKTAIELYRKYANIRMNILPYIYHEAIKVAEQGLAMMRPLFYDFSVDPETYHLETEYMLGDNLLICPITEEGVTDMRIYLPEGYWTDLFTGKRYNGKSYVEYHCPLGTLPVFIREQSITPLNLNRQFELGGCIGNETSSYDQLCFFITGENIDNYIFLDDLGNKINIQVNNKHIEVKSNGPVEKVYMIVPKELELEDQIPIQKYNEHFMLFEVKCV